MANILLNDIALLNARISFSNDDDDDDDDDDADADDDDV